MSLLIWQGNALHLPLRNQSVHCCVTSPPYWGLRDYGVAGQLGSESVPDCLAWARGEAPCGACLVCQLRTVFQEVWRVLRNDGTLWLNLGDSYANDGKWGGTTGGKHVQELHGASVGRRKRQTGLKPKDLCGTPWRVALALQADGWTLRSEIIWHKSNPMPESVTDRPTKSHEQVFLLTKAARYFYDVEAAREDGSPRTHARFAAGAAPRRSGQKWETSHGGSKPNAWAAEQVEGRNARTVWRIPSEPFAGAHFATFPTALVARCIRAGTNERGCCPQCGTPWVRQTSTTYSNPGNRTTNGPRSIDNRAFTAGFAVRLEKHVDTTDWAPRCACFPIVEGTEERPAPVPCVVFDPFAGSGTVPLVARQLGRHGLGMDLSWPYLQLARERLGLSALAAWQHGAPARPVMYDDLPLFAYEDA